MDDLFNWALDPETGDVFNTSQGSTNPYSSYFTGGGPDTTDYGQPSGGADDTGAFDQSGSEGVFDQFGNSLYTSPLTLADLLRGLPGAIGGVAAAKQAQAQKNLATQYLNLGGPSRARYESTFAPGFSMAADPGFKDALDQTMKSFLHKASITGNPAEAPNAWNQSLKDVQAAFTYPALQNYRAMNADTGGISRLTSAAPDFSAAAVRAQKGVWDAAGGAAADVFNPPTSLEEAIRAVRLAGL